MECNNMCMHVAQTCLLFKARWVLDLSCMQLRKASCRFCLARSLGRVGSELAQRLLLALFPCRVEAAEPEPISAALLLKVEALWI